MPLLPGYGKTTIDANVGALMREGKPRAQAVAMALNEARESWYRRHGRTKLPPWHLRTPNEKAKTGYSRNPVPASKHLQQVEQAARLYEKFSGHEAVEVGTLDKEPMPDVLVLIGKVDGILYTTVRDGKTEKYIHRFKAKARPHFAVSPDGKQLFMLGGAYNFTERGIVDET